MTLNLREGKIFPLLLKFTLPIVIGNIFQLVYSFTDTLIVSRFVGVDAMSAIGAIGPINFAVFSFLMGLASGFCIIIGRKLGEQNEFESKSAVINSIYLSLIFSSIFTVLSLCITAETLNILNTPASIYDYAHDYLITVFLGIIPIMFYNLASGIMRAQGDSKTALLFLILTTVLNIILDLVFILNFNLGLMGAGLATVLAQTISAIACFVFCFKKYDLFKFKKEHRKFLARMVKILLVCGLPMALQMSVISIGVFFVQTAVNLMGTVVIGSLTAVSKIEQIAGQFFGALSLTSASFIAQNYGAKDYKRIKQGIKTLTLMGLTVAILMCVTILTFNKPLLLIFISKEDMHLSADIIKYGSKYFLITCPAYIFLCLLAIYRSAIQSMNNWIIPFVACILELVARSVCATFLPPILGYDGICLTASVAWFLGFMCVFTCYFWKIKRVGNEFKQNTLNRKTV